MIAGPVLLSTVLFAAASSPLPVAIEVMVVGGPLGGKVEHGKPAYAELRFRNLSARDVAVPLAIRSLGKETPEQKAGPSYRSDSSWWYTGFLCARVLAIFENQAGKRVTPEQLLVLEDVPKLAPRGYVTLRCLFPSPPEPGVYRLRISLDNSALRNAPGADLGALRGDDLYFSHEITLDGIEVR